MCQNGVLCSNRLMLSSFPIAAEIFAKQIKPLPDDKILGLPKLKAFADDKLSVTQNVKIVFHRIEYIVRKEENAGYQHFLLFPQCFQKAFPPVRQKLSLSGNGLIKFLHLILKKVCRLSPFVHFNFHFFTIQRKFLCIL